MKILPERYRDNWGKAYQFWFVNCPSMIYISDFERLQREAGITDRLIVAVLERAIQTKRLNILAWVRTVLQDLVPYCITTPEEWAEFEEQRQAAEQQPRMAKGVASLREFMDEARREEEEA